MSTLPTVYFSYAWGDGETPEGQLREEVANTIYQEIKKRERAGDLKVVIDREQMKYRDSIRKFTAQYADASLVVMIISEKYLKSKYCMGEVVEVLSNKDYLCRILPVLLPDTELNDDVKCADYFLHWETEQVKIDEKIKQIRNVAYSGSLVQLSEDYAEIIRIIANFTTELRYTITVRPPEYEPMLKALDQQIQELKSKKTPVQNVELISLSAPHRCDRRNILNAFDFYCSQLTKAGNALQCYFLANQKYGEVESLVKRLITHLKEEHSSQKVKYIGWDEIVTTHITFERGTKEDVFRFSLQKAFNRVLTADVASLAEFASSPPPAYESFEYLPFAFKIRLVAGTWESGGESALVWFLKEFCKLSANSPKKVFLFVVLELENETTQSFMRFFGGSKPAITSFDAINYLAEKFELSSFCRALPALEQVDKNDLLDWYSQFEKNEKMREQKTNELIARLGPGDTWHMSDVEPELKKIVEQAQEQKHGI